MLTSAVILWCLRQNHVLKDQRLGYLITMFRGCGISQPKTKVLKHNKAYEDKI